MKRRSEWKQPNPRMQLTTVLAAIEGNLSNVCEGRIPPERLPEIQLRCSKFFRWAHELNAANCGSWDSFEALAQHSDRAT